MNSFRMFQDGVISATEYGFGDMLESDFARRLHVAVDSVITPAPAQMS